MNKLALGFALLAIACSSESISDAGASGGDVSDPTTVELPTSLFAGKSQHSERAAPVAGGTLLVTRDDTTVVAADPDRDRVSFVTLRTLAVASAELEPGSEPGKLIETAAGRIAVILRGAGAVAGFSLDGAALFRTPVCVQPRGLAYLAAQNAILVACRSGLLLKLDADSGLELSRQRFDDDLEDVLIRGDEVVLMRGRSAELMFLDLSGKVLRRGKPSPNASVAFRSVVLPNGEVFMASQEAAAEAGLGYGSHESGCGLRAIRTGFSITRPPRVGPDAPPPGTDPRDFVPSSALTFELHSLDQFVGPIDVAISPRAGKLALLSSGNGFASDLGFGSLMLLSLDPVEGSLSSNLLQVLDDCRPFRTEQLAGQPVAVALDSRGRAFVQSREPAALLLDNGVKVSLGPESRADTGLALFYMNSSGRVSCASCHPGGLEDGRSWTSLNLRGETVRRRTQSLAGGIRARAPYHWSGEEATLTALIADVMIGRMQLPVAPTPAQIDSLEAWLENIPAPAGTDELDLAAVERGQALFFDPEVGCSSCHGGAAFTDDIGHDVGTGGVFYTPSLVAVGARAPYFHDGCASNLSLTLGVCGGPAHEVSLDPGQSEDLVEFLLSL